MGHSHIRYVSTCTIRYITGYDSSADQPPYSHPRKESVWLQSWKLNAGPKRIRQRGKLRSFAGVHLVDLGLHCLQERLHRDTQRDGRELWRLATSGKQDGIAVIEIVEFDPSHNHAEHHSIALLLRIIAPESPTFASRLLGVSSRTTNFVVKNDTVPALGKVRVKRTSALMVDNLPYVVPVVEPVLKTLFSASTL